MPLNFLQLTDHLFYVRYFKKINTVALRHLTYDVITGVMSGRKCVPWHISASNLRASPFFLVIWMWTYIVSSITQGFRRSSGPKRVNRSQLRWNEVNYLRRLFLVLLLSKVIWGADFESDTHFTLRWPEMRSWNHQDIEGQWRHVTPKWFSNFWPLKIVRRH